jgi:hypothetical protein
MLQNLNGYNKIVSLGQRIKDGPDPTIRLHVRMNLLNRIFRHIQPIGFDAAASKRFYKEAPSTSSVENRLRPDILNNTLSNSIEGLNPYVVSLIRSTTIMGVIISIKELG